MVPKPNKNPVIIAISKYRSNYILMSTHAPK